jgi:hypothetical protein
LGERVFVTVEPATPGPTTPVTLSFIAKQSPDPGTAWYGVEVTSTTRNRSCEHSEDAQVAPAQAGKRVNVTLRPVDKRRWCAGSCAGEVTYERRVAVVTASTRACAASRRRWGGSASALSRRRSLSSG